MNSTTAASENYMDEVFEVMMLIGICLSIAGVIVQVCVIAVYRQLRKFDEVILCEMTVARTIIGLCEFYVIYLLQTMGQCALSYVMLTVYIHADVVLLILMYLFTRNLFSKIVSVFSVRSYNLLVLSLVVWLAPSPFSLVCPLLWAKNFEHFSTYYKVYAHIKFAVLTINMLCFFMIVYVTMKRRLDRDRNLAKYLKTMVVVFLLVTMMCLQVFVTDLLAFYYNAIKNDVLVKSFATVNSYQVIAIMAYFVIMVRNRLNHALGATASVRLSDMTNTIVSV